jgi:hypothetical protein
MGWSEVAARSHARRLESEGWLGRVPMLWGQGSMFHVTKLGVRVLGTGLSPQPAPQPNWWAHHSACAWTAAWLTLRERRFLGEPEIRHSGEWSERLQWHEGYRVRRSGHRPDLIAWSPSGHVYAIEVELTQKSRARLNAILRLHNNWMLHHKLDQLFYIVDDEASARRIRVGMKRNLFLSDMKVRIELLDTIKQETIEAFEAKRSNSAAASNIDESESSKPGIAG